MKPKYLILVAGITATLSCGAFAQQDEKLGKLSFPTSCDPKVQAEFERGVAMIHSYWFIYARRAFEGVLQQDPSCAIAYWGIALDFLGNSLATTPTRTEAFFELNVSKDGTKICKTAALRSGTSDSS